MNLHFVHFFPVNSHKIAIQARNLFSLPVTQKMLNQKHSYDQFRVEVEKKM